MMYILEKKKLTQVLSAWIKDFEVFAPQKIGNYAQFLPFDGTQTLSLENPHNTRFPPKALFLPQSEVMLKYNSRLNRLENVGFKVKPRILFGIRPCDAKSFTLLDSVFVNEDYSDPYWNARRKSMIIIGNGCKEPPQTCFCTTVGGGPFHQDGLDALITETKDYYAIQIFTEKAVSLFEGLPIASEKDCDQIEAKQREIAESMPIAFTSENLKEKLDLIFESNYWAKIAESCLGCGVCTFLCPTCFCFDIVDEVQRGERVRNWDTCMFRVYSQEASGHNPRPSKKERTRQRLMHKYSYWLDHISEIGCTGCGRCVRYCPVGLDIRAMLREAGKYENEVAHA